MYVLEITLAAVLLFSIWQFQQSKKLRGRIQRLQFLVAERSEQGAAVKAASIPADIMDLNRPMITIEIDNPLEVASQEVKGADLAGAVVPVVIKKRVYQQVRAELSEELAERGIAARVNVVLNREERQS